MKIPDPIDEALGILGLLVLTTLMDIFVVNFLLEKKRPRKHNKLKLINECLARHQLAYVIWYISLATLMNLGGLTYHESFVSRNAVTLGLLLSALLWFGSVNVVAGQDEIISDAHQCVPKCKGSWQLSLRALWLNGLMAAICLLLGIVIITRPSLDHALEHRPEPPQSQHADKEK